MLNHVLRYASLGRTYFPRFFLALIRTFRDVANYFAANDGSFHVNARSAVRQRAWKVRDNDRIDFGGF